MIARRKIVAKLQDEQQETPEVDKPVKRYYNKAAPVNLHPKTITRMADWQLELDKRIKEQEDMNKRNLKGEESTFQNPFEPIQKVVESLVKGFGCTLGFQDQKSEFGDVEFEQSQKKYSLPPQTFSRRL
jgi:hypothetical protein